MRRVIGFLILAAILVGIAFGLGTLPGEMSATVGTYSFAASLPIVALAVIILFALLYVLIRLVAAIFGAPGRFGRGRHQRQLRQGERAVTRAFAALAAADPKAAKREADRARRLLPQSPMALLISAETARLSGKTEEAEASYRRLAEQSDSAFLGLRGLLRQALDAGDWTLAADLARRAELAHPGAPWLRAERAKLALRTGAWAEALALSGPEAPRAVMATAAADAASDAAQALRLARDAFAADPSLAPAALAYASRLRARGEERKADGVIEKAWTRGPHPDLATFYMARDSDVMARLKAADRLAKCNPEHGESHLILARAALAARLTGQARQEAQAAIAAGLDQRRVWVLRADIEEADAAAGGGEGATFAAHEALRRSQTAQPDPRWRCAACTAEQVEWHPSCPVCGTVGQVAWTNAMAPATRAGGPVITLLPGEAI
ncbi:heme biosynthesis HemY N-terminal domain-containing protein [Acidisoma silvae]|uniref:Heme biosynthesis protein HemY n=1 Tax=Acidisoma silvae TaxID=2802396 RepID=A0A963YUK6_9PROT|nr:heme biosynthesis HemY N-terminal domain-containing protein [Acidisoma silvae]MCB8877356.1 heme biosynthesis protein HemY [Acidisoma silvae]